MRVSKEPEPGQDPPARKPGRRRSRTPLIALLVVEFLLLFFALEHYFSHRRWDVKTLSDPGRARVRMTPVDTTVSALVAFERPEPPGEEVRTEPHETSVYRVRARLIAVHRQLDEDLHLVIADRDDPAKTMVVEVPGPSESKDGLLAERFRRARMAVDTHARGKMPKGGWPVRVAGVGFFDFTHFQPGAAGTGFELHPVLEIDFEGAGDEEPAAARTPVKK